MIIVIIEFLYDERMWGCCGARKMRLWWTHRCCGRVVINFSSFRIVKEITLGGASWEGYAKDYWEYENKFYNIEKNKNEEVEKYQKEQRRKSLKEQIERLQEELKTL